MHQDHLKCRSDVEDNTEPDGEGTTVQLDSQLNSVNK